MPNLCLPSLRLTVSTSEASVSSVSGESCCLKLAKSLPSESTWLGLGLGLGLGLRPGAQGAGAVERGWGDAEGGAESDMRLVGGRGGGGGGGGGGGAGAAAEAAEAAEAVEAVWRAGGDSEAPSCTARPGGEGGGGGYLWGGGVRTLPFTVVFLSSLYKHPKARSTSLLVAAFLISAPTCISDETLW